MRRRYVVLLAAVLALAAPAGCVGARPRGDGRPRLPARARRRRRETLAGVVAFRSSTAIARCASTSTRGLMVVQGDLGEPMLRISSAGALANRASVTAAAEKIVSAGTRLEAGLAGSSFTWHEHRLAPPPYDGGRIGARGDSSRSRRSWTVTTSRSAGRSCGTPGRRSGRGRRSPPSSAVALVAALRRRPELARTVDDAARRVGGARRAGDARGVRSGGRAERAGRVGAVRRSPSRSPRSSTACSSVCSGIRRVQLAGFIGLAAAVVSLSYLSVFWHGVVISLLSATASRGLLRGGRSRPARRPPCRASRSEEPA